ncbi:hypothetical protein [Shivajiella indica]|uniref:Uncharacterized protein n=1 Tax=Shivajiella indica TaxID=872115 RepID=A0ABW5BEP3_9BACT
MCGTPPPPPSSPTPPPTVTVLISATNAAPFPPAISDGTNIVYSENDDTNLITDVKAGYNIIFKKAGDISSILGISETGGTNVFSSLPTLQPDGTWKGVIGSFPPNSEESYNISYVVNGVTYNQDPKIRINQ